MKNMIHNFWKDEEGATAIEYGLIAGLIAVAIIAGASALGTSLNDTFCAVGGVLENPQSTYAAALATCKA